MNTPREHLTNHDEEVLFVIGAGRSGTTLLYKSLCLHPDIAWISNYLARFPGNRLWPLLNRGVAFFPSVRKRAWFGTDSNAYFNKRNALIKLVPTPVEGESVFSRCDIPLYPGHDWEITKKQSACIAKAFHDIRRAQGAKLFMSKRTANNRRIPQLFSAFPKARFLYIIRDGRATATSMLRAPWWQDHEVWWLNQKTPRQWEQEGGNPLELAARNWVEEIKEIERGLEQVPNHHVMQIRYEDLIVDPANVWAAIELFLGVHRSEGWFSEVSKLKLADQNRSWIETLSSAEKDILNSVQRELLSSFGYR